jgi:Lon protease-like protein
MAETKIIPIFPLDLVLFPRQELPLRVFEPRYKQLVDDCMLGDGQFGVCKKKNKKDTKAKEKTKEREQKEGKDRKGKEKKR